MDQAKFLQLLEGVLTSDTARVKEATSILRKDYYSSHECLPLLLQLLTSHESPQLRQLAATQARSLIPRHWAAVPQTYKPQIRTHLLQATFQEQTSIVRHAAARVISTIAKIDIEDGQWADLPSLMQQAAVSNNIQEREVSTYILFTILECMGDDYVHRFQELFALFSSTIHDPQSAEVRINTMLALGKMAMLIDVDEDEASLQAFYKALPDMVAILKQAIDAGDEERTMQAFEVFQNLLECDSKLLNVHFRDLVQFIAGIATDEAYDQESRSQSLNFLINAVLYRKLKFQGLRIGKQLTAKLLEILAEPSNDTDDDDDGFSLGMLAQTLLGSMSSSLPPSQIVVPVIYGFKSYAVSPDFQKRKAGINALGAVVEGAPDFIDSQLPELIPLVLQLLNDPEIQVRRAASIGTQLLAEQLSETMGKEHQSFISSLIKNLDAAVQGMDGTDGKICLDVAIQCCTAIDSLVEGLEVDDIKQYLPKLIPHLSHLFSHPDTKLKAASITAVGSIAKSAKDEYLPYFEQTMNSMSAYVQIKESEDELTLRATTNDALGNLALAVGAKPFQRYVQPLMEATEESVQLDDSRLKESTYLLWGALAKVYGIDFKPFLSGVVKGLLGSLEQEENEFEVEVGEEAADLIGQEVTIAGKRLKVIAPHVSNGLPEGKITAKDGSDHDDDDDDGDYEEEEDDDDDDWDDVTGISPVLEEKEVALESLGEVLVFTREEFLPHLEKTMAIILPMVHHHYEAIRRAAISTLFRAYATLWQIQEKQMDKWQPGLPLKVQPTADIAKLGDVIISETLGQWQEDIDSYVVIEFNRSLNETLRTCGPSIISGNKVAEKIAETLLAIIEKQHACQTEDEDSDDEENERLESSEDDWVVIDTALDLITALAMVLGEQFAHLWNRFGKIIVKFASSTEQIQRASAVGTIADIIRGMGNAITPFTTPLLKILLHRMSDEHALARSNAAFAIGLLVENSDNDSEILRSYNNILTKLEPLLQTDHARLLDNAVGCVSRMIMKHRDRVPLADVLPVILGLLPIKEDWEENEPIYRMIVQLYSSGEPTIIDLTSKLIPIVSQVMSPPDKQLTDEIREQLGQLVRFVHGKDRAVVEQHENLRNMVHA